MGDIIVRFCVYIIHFFVGINVGIKTNLVEDIDLKVPSVTTEGELRSPTRILFNLSFFIWKTYIVKKWSS